MDRAVPNQHTDATEEAAAAKLWAVYISEAEKYDKSLVESWKSDMEGLLIFAGLFSASLTAFIIESYKTLTPGTGDATVQILTQISQQLAASMSGNMAAPPAPSSHFTPSAASLICNIFWFISLGLSLTCALIATLLQQWARDFLHRADMRSSPIIRARIFSFLYYGLRQFNMHIIVDIIPLLLHASLVLFFAGLVAFLIPINIGIAAVAVAMLGIVACVYSALSLAPLWHLDSPYRTPLTNACWFLWHCIRNLWRPWGQENDCAMQTIGEAIEQQAMEISPARNARDQRALIWTLKSLADENELEPFVEAIPDLLWGPNGMRQAYNDRILTLLNTPDLRFFSRIVGLLGSCENGLLSVEEVKPRATTCLKALWAISSMLALSISPIIPQTDSHLFAYSNSISHYNGFNDSPHWMHHYIYSIIALLNFSNFRFVCHHLAECEADVANGRCPDLQPIHSYIFLGGFRFRSLVGRGIDENQSIWNSLKASNEDTQQFAQAAQRFRLLFSYLIPVSFISDAMSLNSLPYQWETMMTLITPNLDLADPLMDCVESPLELAIYGHLVKPDLTKDHMATIISAFVSLWRPETATCIHGAIIHYIVSQTDEVLTDLTRGIPIATYFWKCLKYTLSTPLGGRSTLFLQTLDHILFAVWRLLILGQGFVLPIGGDVLEALLQLPPSPLTTSVIALVKMNILQSSLWSHVLHPSILKPLMPTETAFDALDEIPTEFPRKVIWHNGGTGFQTSYSEEREAFNECILEAQLSLTISFLENCHQGRQALPYKAKETLQYLRCSSPNRMIHNSYKIRLAQAMYDLLRDNSWDLLKVLTQCDIFAVYSWGDTGSFNQSPKWLDDAAPRAQVTEALTGLLSQESAATMVQRILAGLEKFHGTANLL